jgi:GNAT superfamily N-acetyltransferase
MEWKRDAFTVTDDPARQDLAAIFALLRSTYWAGDRASEAIETSLRNSLAFALYDGDRQIGMARVVTDRATVGYLCDVVISDDYRGQGLGKWFLECILAHPDLKDCRIDLFTRDAQDFYRAFGFGPHRFTSMVRYPPGREPANVTS